VVSVNNEKLIVSLDVDGVLFPFYEETLRELSAWGVPMECPIDCGWDFVRAMTTRQLEIAKNLWANDEFTKGFNVQPILPYPWAKDLYDAIAAEAQVLIVTSPMSVPYWVSGRDIWLKNHFGHDKRDTVYAAHKHLIQCDLLIDDRPLNVIQFAQNRLSDRISILVEREYSRNDPHWEEACAVAWKVAGPDQLVEVTKQAITKLKKDFNL